MRRWVRGAVAVVELHDSLDLRSTRRPDPVVVESIVGIPSVVLEMHLQVDLVGGHHSAPGPPHDIDDRP